MGGLAPTDSPYLASRWSSARAEHLEYGSRGWGSWGRPAKQQTLGGRVSRGCPLRSTAGNGGGHVEDGGRRHRQAHGRRAGQGTARGCTFQLATALYHQHWHGIEPSEAPVVHLQVQVRGPSQKNSRSQIPIPSIPFGHSHSIEDARPRDRSQKPSAMPIKSAPSSVRPLASRATLTRACWQPRRRHHPEDMWKDKRCAAHANSGTHVGDPLSLDGDSKVSDSDEAEYLELTGSPSENNNTQVCHCC